MTTHLGLAPGRITNVLVLQSSCDIGTPVALCEQHDLDHEQLAERPGVDGDAFTLVLVTSAKAAALRASEGVIRALLDIGIR
jgi:hypothetical protein